MPIVEELLIAELEKEFRAAFNLPPDLPMGVESLKLARIVAAGVKYAVENNEVNVTNTDGTTGVGKFT